MPINKKSDGWYWGGQGPFKSRKKAEEVSQAAHASGYNKMDKACLLYTSPSPRD